MRARMKLALGGGALTTATALSIAVGGVISAGTLVVVDPLAPVAKADGLVPFDDCAALREWYVSRAVDEVGPYGWNGTMWGGDVVMYRSAMPMGDSLSSMPLAANAEADLPRVNSATGTNTQEEDVDEPDVAKTNGDLVVRMRGDKLVVADVSGTEPRVVGRLDLPGKDVSGAELLLVGDHALVLAGDYRQVPYPEEAIPDFVSFRPEYWQVPTGTKLFDVDLSDPTAPRLAHVDRYTGSLVSARQYGSTIRLVTTDGRPELPFVTPRKGVSEQQATRRNRALVRATTVEDWLPAVTTNGQRSALVDCKDVLHPKNWSGQATLAVTTFDAGDVEDRTSVAITAEGHVVYSSTDRLYVAANRMEEPVAWRADGGRLDRRIVPLEVKTDLHAFALDGEGTTYVASGEIDGTLRDRWSLDERDGVLRVAWTREGRRGGTRNGITTLTERDGDLVRLGEIDDLGIDENIQSVRWLGAIAIVVTFRQVDPLYTIDLTDPARPRELGALKIPGYSGYLHPVGSDRLLGLGVHATNDGSSLGGQAATFDIADLTKPRRLDTVGFGRDTELVAVNEPRTFTWLADHETGLTVVSDWNTGRSRLVALRVAADGTLTERTALARVDGWETRVLPLDDGRAVVVDRELRIVDLG